MSKPDWTGILKHGAGFRATVSQGRGRPRLRRHFPAGTPIATMQAWRKDAIASARVTRKQRAHTGTFEGDARQYLKAVASMTTINTRTKMIEEWIAIFGTRARDSITSVEIQIERERLLTTPRQRRGKTLKPYGAMSVNHRLRALSNLFTVLDAGTGAKNPVREVAEATPPKPTPRALSYATITRIIEAMPDRGRPTGKGKGTRPKVSNTKARLRVFAYTGLPAHQLQALTSADVDLEHGLIRLAGRSKGEGTEAVVLPLRPEAILAFQEFDALGLWGHFSASALNKSFQRAAKRLGLTVRAYDIRHSFGTALYRATQNKAFVRDMMQHRDDRTTDRYVMEAQADALAVNLDRVDFGRKPGAK